ncbi:MAG: hypothetical protein CR997_10755 [Acidobacteria bacterium]|nr:MAG: hypothetical protein CR997_10755 [Acidobacteriota bacterium]
MVKKIGPLIVIKNVKCPVCGAWQPFFRIPKTIRQALYGGWTCKGCLSELDVHGELIESHKHNTLGIKNNT